MALRDVLHALKVRGFGTPTEGPRPRRATVGDATFGSFRGDEAARIEANQNHVEACETGAKTAVEG